MALECPYCKSSISPNHQRHDCLSCGKDLPQSIKHYLKIPSVWNDGWTLAIALLKLGATLNAAGGLIGGIGLMAGGISSQSDNILLGFIYVIGGLIVYSILTLVASAFEDIRIMRNVLTAWERDRLKGASSLDSRSSND